MKKAAVPSILIAVVLLAVAVIAEAQQPKKVPRIGYLSVNDAVGAAESEEAIRLALREHGYIEGQNIAIEYRYSAGKPERAPELAAELVRLQVDVIVAAGGPTWVEAAKNATKTIPIVMVGLLASLRKHPCDFCNGANRGSCPSSDHFGFKRDCPHLGGNA